MGRQGAPLVIAVIALLAFVLGGCGSDSKGATTAASTQQTGTKKPVRSRPFLGESGENYAAVFGYESDAAELAEARKVVRKSFEARQHHEWAAQCGTLSAKARRGAKTVSICASRLRREAKEVPESVLENNLAGVVIALRVEDDFAYALYHGKDKQNWALPMEREDGEWKVGSLVSEELI
jgi:hypothetical protein